MWDGKGAAATTMLTSFLLQSGGEGNVGGHGWERRLAFSALAAASPTLLLAAGRAGELPLHHTLIPRKPQGSADQPLQQ